LKLNEKILDAIDIEKNPKRTLRRLDYRKALEKKESNAEIEKDQIVSIKEIISQTNQRTTIAAV